MHRVLVRRFNERVGKSDVAYFLGDMTWKGDAEGCKAIISQLNGHKILVIGNHDKKTVPANLARGFDSVCHGGMLKVGGKTLTFSHFPLLNIPRENTENMARHTVGDAWHGESKYREGCFVDLGEHHFHVHGHLHAPNKGRSEVKLGRQWDIGVDGNDLDPVSLKQITKWMDKEGK